MAASPDRTRQQHMQRFATLATLDPPRVARVLGGIILSGLTVVLLILFTVPWVQTSSGYGAVVALDPDERLQTVTALVPGRVDQWFVHDGQKVTRGQPIARIADNDPELLARLGAERAQVEAEISAAEQAMSVAQIDVGRSRQLLSEGLIARRDYEVSQIKVADYRVKLAEARAKLNRVNVALSRQSAQVVRAPRDGRIQSINAAASGTLVSAGDVLATLGPDRPERVIELLINGRDIVLIHPGRLVRLEFEGWPAIQFSGWPTISAGMFDGRVRSVDPSARPDGLFRVLVEPRPDRRPWPSVDDIRLGAKVRGWVQMETVRVGYELWRQLNNFPPEYGPAVAAAMNPKDKGKSDYAGGDKSGGDGAKDGYGGK